ncbi:hypothetical protein Moror_3399 [Moniliophthora roreri MCA 2997]|uniref:Uncharacterized protein n=2 Tax=Moniliophthora roreri TaxID=221103 RepID=V2WJ85_MONRO|nr:hypothetical protein Moror_3399 [Moniliophthora roreri MCA 2997]
MSKRAVPDSARPPSPPTQRRTLLGTKYASLMNDAGTPSNRSPKAGNTSSVTPKHAIQRPNTLLSNKSTAQSQSQLQSSSSQSAAPQLPNQKLPSCIEDFPLLPVSDSNMPPRAMVQFVHAMYVGKLGYSMAAAPDDVRTEAWASVLVDLAKLGIAVEVPPSHAHLVQHSQQQAPKSLLQRLSDIPTGAERRSSSSRTGGEADALAQLHTEIQLREISLTALRAELSGKIRDEMDRTMVELDQTRGELVKVRSEVKNLENEKEMLKGVQKAVAKEQAELGRLKEGKAKLDSEVQRLHTEVNARSEELRKSEVEKERLGNEIQQMRVEHAKITEEKEELGRLRREKQNVVRELDDLRSKLEGLLGCNPSSEQPVKRERSPSWS